eukprot:COSAG05_NODE_1682_length_4285_cov_33.861682_11_plen_64_part_00
MLPCVPFWLCCAQLAALKRGNREELLSSCRAADDSGSDVSTSSGSTAALIAELKQQVYRAFPT